MQLKHVVSLTPEERFLYWINEREFIRRKKEAGDSKPWTDDEILKTYKFCNVRRMDDRVSQWLLHNWYLPYYDHSNMITACTLARQLNNTDSLEEVGFPNRWNPVQVEKILNSRVSRGLKNFSAAYMITGTLGGTKIQQIVNKVVTPIHAQRKKIICDSCTSQMYNMWNTLLPFAGFSTFISGQVVADMRHAVSGDWYDYKYWAPVGPGSCRGVNRLYDMPLGQKHPHDEFLRYLESTIHLLRDTLDTSLFNRLEAIDVQSCLCEYDKYSRTLLGEGRPKQKYPGS